MHNSTTRFSNRAEDYVKYRPSYPKEVISWLEKNAGLQHDSVIADIGSGTGIISQLFLENGNKVFGVEPNKEMREKGESLLAQYSSFTSINGSAENTMLPDAFADMIIAAQAFHWFDQAKAKTEAKRIAKKHTYFVIVWNERLVESPFEKEYEQLLLDYATDYAAVNHVNIGEAQIANFFAPNDYRLKIFPNKQVFDFDGVKGRLLSSSYTPDAAHPSFNKMLDALQRIFTEHAVNNSVEFNYATKLYAGKIA